jgi:ubiquinol-cytochrome c reductase cytochrome b subunit
MHHWAALLFMAAIVVHMARTFFTGAFRKPREANWAIGVAAVLARLPRRLHRLLAARRRAVRHRPADRHAIMLSIPVVGTWVATSLFGGEFPGDVILAGFYIAHVLLIPGVLLALITVHMGLLVKQKHTQWPGPGGPTTTWSACGCSPASRPRPAASSCSCSR